MRLYFYPKSERERKVIQRTVFRAEPRRGSSCKLYQTGIALLLDILKSKIPRTNWWGFTTEPRTLQLHPTWKTVVSQLVVHLYTRCPCAFSYSGTARRSPALTTQPHTAQWVGCWLNAYTKAFFFQGKGHGLNPIASLISSCWSNPSVALRQNQE